MIRAEMYEIAPCPQGHLAIMPRPRGGEWLAREIGSLKAIGVTDLVSLLTPAEEAELNLRDEEKICTALEIRFHRHTVNDRGIPLRPEFDRFIDTLLPILQAGGYIAIHCRAGIGRSSVTAAALLIRLGVSADEAIDLISHSRGFDVPDTDEQLDFVYSLDQGAASS